MPFVHARSLLVKNKTLGVDATADAILSGTEPQASLFAKAKELWLSPIKKSYIESCLIATQDLGKIEALLGVPVDVLDMYLQMYFDVRGFDKLSFLEVVEDTEDSEERSMKIWALSQGLDFVSWRLGKVVDIDPVVGLKELFTLCVFKSKEALFSGNASESSKEATKWTKLSMDMARLLKAWVSDTSAARKDIELALSSIAPDFPGFDNLL